MVNKIYHLADIHFRLFKRHQEYRQVLNGFFDYVDGTKEENDVIVLAGDIVHSKTEMSPELVQLVSEFLKDCADRLPTILILGNHDLNLKSPNRLDSLSPIVNSLNHPNIHFWKESGVYEFNGVHFSVMSVLGHPTDWKMAPEISGSYKIAIHHGTVSGAMTDLGFQAVNDLVTPLEFDGFDIVLLGDIHRFQYLDPNKTIAYSGSPIQQNHGESLEKHGFLVWDLETRRSKFISLKNEYGYYTFHFKDGKCINRPEYLPNTIRTRVVYENTAKDVIQEFLKSLSSNHVISDVVFKRQKSDTTLKTYETHILSKDFTDIENQNNLLIEYINDVLKITDDEVLDGIRHINREINSEFQYKKLLRGVVWKLKKFEFSNIFSYGENNVVDFENFNGVIGIFAPNASGKSAFLSALSFCLFDKCPVGSKGSHILNNRKNEFKCRVNFEISGIDYFIERIGTKNEKSGSVKVDVKFWSEDSQGIIENLTGEDRDSTNRNIREYIGTYEDFTMLSLSSQVDNQTFIDKTQRDRKELLYRLLDLSIFDELNKSAKERLREVQVYLKELDEDQILLSIGESKTKIVEYREFSSDLQREMNITEERIKFLTDENNRLSSRINTSIVDYDIDNLQQSLKSTLDRIQSIEIQITENNISLSTNSENLNSITNSLQEYDEIQSKISILTENKNTERNLINEIERTSEKINVLREKIGYLSNHEYDPECRYCIQNQFVIDAKNAAQQLSSTHEKLTNLQDELSQIQETLVGFEEIQKKYSDMLELQKKEKILQYQVKTDLQVQNSLAESLTVSNEKVELLKQQIENYNQQQIAISLNRNLTLEIQKNIDCIEKLQAELADLHRKNKNVFALLTTEIERHKKFTLDCEKLQKYSKIQYSYDIYCKATSKEGIPYRILSIILPLVEHEVNEILSNLVDFTIKLEASDDKYVYGYIVYSEDKKWPIEMTSGMERFIISQCIRTALAEISSLPKPSFIAIDEGFGVLDSENLNSIHLLFQQIKEHLDFVLCISHIDSMKDMVDDILPIYKENDFSKVYVS